MYQFAVTSGQFPVFFCKLETANLIAKPKRFKLY